MHQLSFPAFAAAQQPPAPVKPVRFGCPFDLQNNRTILDVRRDDWFFSDDAEGYCLDATRHIPTGGHESSDHGDLFYVRGHQSRVEQ